MGGMAPPAPFGSRLQNDLEGVEWDVKLYYTIPYPAWIFSAQPLLDQCENAMKCKKRRLTEHH